MRRSRLISFLGIVLLLISGFISFASAATIEGGDASSLADADVLLDIAFLIDTSSSMSDEATTISNIMGDVASNIECPNCDVWIRADFYGIFGTSGIFDQNMDDITGDTSQTITNNREDNAPAVTDMMNFSSLWSNDDTEADQDYYRAIVTIGDEGTENGYPVNDADWAAAEQANQQAITDGFFIFSLAGSPWSSYESDADNMRAVFEALAVGGTGGSVDQYVLGDTGGTFANTTSVTLQEDIEAIICTAAGGGTGGGGDVPVPEPGTILLMGVGLAGLAASRLRKKRN